MNQPEQDTTTAADVGRVSKKSKRPMNPFYVMLLLAGIAFAITACAYGVMTVRQLNASRAAGYGFDSSDQSQPADFNALVDQYGPKAMIIEIIVLGIGTAGAIAYDQRLDRLTGEASANS